MTSANTSLNPVQRFWRSADLPFIEAREVSDGRVVHYDRHSHDTFSIGAITGGRSSYVNGDARQQIEQGSVVIINPGEVHACNPLGDVRWSYLMLYVDAQWLARLQGECGSGNGPAFRPSFRPFTISLSRDASLYAGVCALYATLINPDADLFHKECAAIAFFSGLVQQLAATSPPLQRAPDNPRLARAAAYIAAHCTQPLRLDEICKSADLSPSYLIRAFKLRYAMTPHEYLTNCRIQFSRVQLARGVPIVSVAADAGFADQAHFNRAFKRLVAATPGQYRSAMPDQNARGADANEEARRRRKS